MAKIDLIDLKELPEIKPFRGNPDGSLVDDFYRDAEFWHPTEGDTIGCTLCYRRCEIPPDTAGWCGWRGNLDGKMVLPDYGQLGAFNRLILGYRGSVTTFHPGAATLAVGSTHCTAGCKFCISRNIVWNPEKLKWLPQRNAWGMQFTPTTGQWPGAGLWAYRRGMVHPLGVVAEAKKYGVTHLLFDRNEPTSSYEFTFDCARLAKRQGLTVMLDSNGFSTPEAIKRLAPFVDMVMVGAKGALSERFYARSMESEGATEHVKRAILTWLECGVYVVIADLIATQIQQPDAEFNEEAPAFYAWVREHCGEHTPLVYTPMLVPGDANGYLLPPKEKLHEAYESRIDRVAELTQAAGLHYAHGGRVGWSIQCHSCAGLLLRVHTPDACQYKQCQFYTHGCTCYSHEQHVTNEHCDHCGVKVPIVTLSPAALGERQVSPA